MRVVGRWNKAVLMKSSCRIGPNQVTAHAGICAQPSMKFIAGIMMLENLISDMGPANISFTITASG